MLTARLRSLFQGLNEDSLAFQNAVSERFGNFLRNLTTCIAGLIVGKKKSDKFILTCISAPNDFPCLSLQLSGVGGIWPSSSSQHFLS